MKLQKHHIVRFLNIILIFLGTGAIITALCADRLGYGGKTGIGVQQAALLIAGFIVVCFGIYLFLPQGRQTLEAVISPSEEQGRPVSILWLIVWFGLLTGLGETLYILYEGAALNHFFMRSYHFVWMIPLGEMALFLIPGMVLFLITRDRLQTAWAYITFFIFSFIGFLSLMFLFERLQFYAQLLLAIGLAVQTVRMIVSHRKHFYSLVRISLSWLVTGVFLLWASLLVLIP